MKNIPKKVENLSVTTSSGKHQSSTSVLKGEAKKSGAENEKNSLSKYSSGSGNCTGPFGGLNTVG